jgi:hypothetical protein
MTRPYKLSTAEPLAPTHPLHWTQFWPDLQRLHRGRSEARQDLVLWLANLYHGTIRSGKPRAFCSVQVQLTELREWVRDYRPALDYFFEVKQLGYHLDEEKREITTLVPKFLKPEELGLIEAVSNEARFTPPPLPEHATISKIHLRPNLDLKSLIVRTLIDGRPELVPPLRWLVKQSSELNFHFVPSGRLKQRDTSIWPISGIETWPSWLREELFGPGIDLDAAYIQFLMEHLKLAFKNKRHLLPTLFPDLIRLLDDKEAFRRELCTQVLQQPYDEKNRALIKRVLMSIANGSRASAAVLTNGAEFSQTAKLINDAAPNATLSELTTIGNRLQRISDQFASAKKYACVELLKLAPSRVNVKAVFSSYFAWERKARYALWEACDRHGIMVHDGLDGVPQEYLDRLPELIKTLGLRLTA